MSFRFPKKEEFDRIRFTISSIFEIVLMVLAMIAVIGVAWNHIR